MLDMKGISTEGRVAEKGPARIPHSKPCAAQTDPEWLSQTRVRHWICARSLTSRHSYKHAHSSKQADSYLKPTALGAGMPCAGLWAMSRH